MSSTLISVVICTVNRADGAAAVAKSVLAGDYQDFELLVVDQSRDTSTEEALAELRDDPRLRYVRTDRVGLSAAYNAAIGMTSGPIIARVDDDCVAPADWLTSIAEAFRRHPDIDLLYGQMLAGPGTRNASNVVPAVHIQRELKLGKGYGFEVGAMGSNFAVRRDLVQRIGGFDEALGAGGPLHSSEDFDFQYRAYRAGAVALRSPEVWVYHYGARNREQWFRSLRSYGIGDGAFYVKHIRCGDMFALWLLVTRMGRLFLRELRSAMRRRPVQFIYLRSHLTGMRLGLGYGVDRELRLYRPPKGART